MSGSEPASVLSEKLDVLIRIQAALAVKDLPTQKEKIIFLSGAGLGPTYIANLLSTPIGTVTGTLAKHKKAAAFKPETKGE